MSKIQPLCSNAIYDSIWILVCPGLVAGLAIRWIACIEAFKKQFFYDGKNLFSCLIATADNFFDFFRNFPKPN